MFTYFGINTFSLEIGRKRLLVDPVLTGDLTFFGQSWAYAGARKADAQAATDALVSPRYVHERFDAVVLSQGLEDHTHLPTLRQIDRHMDIIASPSAAVVVQKLGFQRVTALAPWQSTELGGNLRITALPGSVVGPPWDKPENGYVFADTRPGGLTVGAEPHGNFLGPALGTSLRMLPRAPPLQIDALLVPMTSQLLGSYRLVNGAREAIDTLEALTPMPRFVLPLQNGEVDAIGAIVGAMSSEGSPAEFVKLLRGRPRLRGVRVLEVTPGRPVHIA